MVEKIVEIKYSKHLNTRNIRKPDFDQTGNTNSHLHSKDPRFPEEVKNFKIVRTTTKCSSSHPECRTSISKHTAPRWSRQPYYN